jgi:hypothetical protein
MKELLLAIFVIAAAAIVGRVFSFAREREFERIERRLNEAEQNYPAARFNRIRAELGWRNF